MRITDESTTGMMTRMALCPAMFEFQSSKCLVTILELCDLLVVWLRCTQHAEVTEGSSEQLVVDPTLHLGFGPCHHHVSFLVGLSSPQSVFRAMTLSQRCSWLIPRGAISEIKCNTPVPNLTVNQSSSTLDSAVANSGRCLRTSRLPDGIDLDLHQGGTQSSALPITDK